MTGSSHTSLRTSRRTFLGNTAIAVAGTVLGAQKLRAGSPVLLPRDSVAPADAFFHERSAPSELQNLAHHAIDAAKSAGASYADVRIAQRYELEADATRILIYSRLSYGVRALVDGVWGFSYGRLPTIDALTRCAQQAVSAGKVSARLSTVLPGTVTASKEWTPQPVVTGEWQTPNVIDPFTVPAQQHSELTQAIGGILGRRPGIDGTYWIRWTRENRVVATTTGTLVTQQLYRAAPLLFAHGTFGQSSMPLSVPEFHSASGGYELLRVPTLLDQFADAADRCARLVRYPVRTLDVGRYPVIVDGCAMASILTSLVGPSLDLDRVLGHDTEGSGSSQWSLDRLGTPVGSALLTVTGDRAIPSFNAARWDDEGVECRETTLVKDGVLMDYHTTGSTVGALESWYRQQNRPLVSNGCATAVDAYDAVSVRPAHLTMVPSSKPASVADLYKDLDRGLVVLGSVTINPDQQLSSGSISFSDGIFEISRGKIVRRAQNVMLQFNTLPFLKGLLAVGDRTTVQTQDGWLSKGMPWVTTHQDATAPAALFKEVNVMAAK